MASLFSSRQTLFEVGEIATGPKALMEPGQGDSFRRGQ